MKLKIYAGVGSRETPEPVLKLMFKIAALLAKRGYTLRSGAADGADTAFELGCNSVDGKKEIWLPWKGFNKHEDTGLYPNPGHFAKAEVALSHWAKLTQGMKRLHARNVGQVLGAHLEEPVDFVLCWTPDGATTREQCTSKTGGTGTAIKLASDNNIPVINLYNYTDTTVLEADIKKLLKAK